MKSRCARSKPLLIWLPLLVDPHSRASSRLSRSTGSSGRPSSTSRLPSSSSTRSSSSSRSVIYPPLGPPSLSLQLSPLILPRGFTETSLTLVSPSSHLPDQVRGPSDQDQAGLDASSTARSNWFKIHTHRRLPDEQEGADRERRRRRRRQNQKLSYEGLSSRGRTARHATKRVRPEAKTGSERWTNPSLRARLTCQVTDPRRAGRKVGGAHRQREDDLSSQRGSYHCGRAIQGRDETEAGRRGKR